MAVDISGLNKAELVALKAEVEAAIVTREAEDRESALDAARKAAAEFGFELSELTGSASTRKGAKASGSSSVVAKYRNPADASQTWSGRGRRPQWFKDAEDSGTSREDMAI